MPDDSNRSESEGRVINLPRPGEAYVPPPAARYADAARGAEDTVARAPEIPAAPPPPAQAAFRSEGIPAPSAAPVEYVESQAEYESGEEYGEYAERRNFAEVFSDWLQHLVDAARQNRNEHAAFREAQVADKVARLNAETEREMGLLAQHNELRKAQLGARAAQTSAAAGGKGSGGTGAGHRSGPGPVNRGPAGGSGGGPSGGRNSGGTGGGGSGSGGNGGGRGPGGAHNRPGERHFEDRRKAPKEPSGGSGSRGRTEGPGGGLTGRQNGSGGPSGSHGSHGSGKPGKSGSSGGPGKPGSSGSSSGGGAGRGGSGGGERPRTWSAAAAERSRARQERSAARQNADLADRTKDRDSERAHRERVRDDDYARKQRRKERRQESGSRRVDLARELLEQWRRKSDPKPDEASPKPDEAGSKPDGASPKPDEPGPKPQGPGPKPDTPGPKVGLGKGTDGGPAPGAGPETGPGSGPQAKGAGETGADDDYGSAATGDGWTQFLRKLHDTTQADKEKADNDGTGTGDGWTEFLGKVSDQHPPHGGPEAETVSPGNPDMAARRPAGSEDDDILDAEIVVDEQPGERTAASGPAPEAHFRRPDLLWPEEVPMPTGPPPARPWSSAESRRLASRHETKVTFSEFLITMANIKVNSARDAQNIENAVANLAVWAERWKRMCAELGGTHNLERKVVRLLDALAAMSESTAAHAGRLYKAVDTAAQKAAETAQGVAQIYQEDLEAMREGGLEEASAAVHHQ